VFLKEGDEYIQLFYSEFVVSFVVVIFDRL